MSLKVDHDKLNTLQDLKQPREKKINEYHKSNLTINKSTNEIK